MMPNSTVEAIFEVDFKKWQLKNPYIFANELKLQRKIKGEEEGEKTPFNGIKILKGGMGDVKLVQYL